MVRTRLFHCRGPGFNPQSGQNNNNNKTHIMLIGYRGANVITLGGRSRCRGSRRVSIDSVQGANLDSMNGGVYVDNIGLGSVDRVVDIDSEGAVSTGVHESQKRLLGAVVCW